MSSAAKLNPALEDLLQQALQQAGGDKRKAKRQVLQAVSTNPSLLLALAEPFMDSIIGYAIDLYARKHPAAISHSSAGALGPTPVQAAPQISPKQKAAIELLAASYKKKN